MLTDDPPEESSRLIPGWAEVAVGLALVALGVLARCVRWHNVFTPAAIELVPADSHYYMRFALRQLAHFPHFDRFDPYVNYPTGAEIYWPPLHTWIVGGFITLFGKGRPELGAAFVDPALAAVEMIILGVVTRRFFGRGAAAILLSLYALLPASVFCSPLGDADHHVHEPFFAALSCLLVAHAAETGSRRLAVATGVALGMSRLFSPIEPLIVVPTALSCLAIIVVARRSSAAQSGPRVAAEAGAAAAVVLLAGVAAFGDLRSFGYEPLSLFQPLFALALFLGAAGLGQLVHGSRRGWVTVALSALCAAALVPEFGRALEHLGRSDPILATVDESRPLTFGQADDLLGVTLLVLPLSLFGAFQLWRAGLVRGIPPVVFTVVLLVPALRQFRFIQAFAGAIVVLTALALPSAVSALAQFGASLVEGGARASLVGGGLYAVGGALLLPALVPPAPGLPDMEVRLTRPSFYWIRDHTPSPSPDPMGDARPSYAIVANPMVGHFLAFWAERPAVSSTFSQAPVHVAGNERSARVFAALLEDDAYQRMVETGGRYFLVTPFLCPLGLVDANCNSADQWLPVYGGSFASHLLEDAALSAPGASHFRLVYDSVEQRERERGGSYVRLFEAVPGAVLEGAAPPGTVVTARLPLVDNLGAALSYQRAARADSRGHFEIRVAYPTSDPDSPAVHPAAGAKGYTLEIPGAASRVALVPVDAVRSGQHIPVPG